MQNENGQRLFLIGCAIVLFAALLPSLICRAANAKAIKKTSHLQKPGKNAGDLNLPSDRRSFIKSIQQTVLIYWNELEKKGTIPDSFKHELACSPVVRIEVFSDHVVQAWITLSSGSSAVDELAVSCAKKFKPDVFPSSKKRESVVTLVTFPIALSSASMDAKSTMPRANKSTVTPISQEELSEFHRERREMDDKSLEVKREWFNRSNLKPWEELTPYGCDILNSKYPRR